jgi:hypothetical protein
MFSLFLHDYYIIEVLRHRFSDKDLETVKELIKIPTVVDDIAGFLTPEEPTILSDSTHIEGVQVDQIKR